MWSRRVVGSASPATGGSELDAGNCVTLGAVPFGAQSDRGRGERLRAKGAGRACPKVQSSSLQKSTDKVKRWYICLLTSNSTFCL